MGYYIPSEDSFASLMTLLSDGPTTYHEISEKISHMSLIPLMNQGYIVREKIDGLFYYGLPGCVFPTPTGISWLSRPRSRRSNVDRVSRHIPNSVIIDTSIEEKVDRIKKGFDELFELTRMGIVFDW